MLTCVSGKSVYMDTWAAKGNVEEEVSAHCLDFFHII